VEEVSKTLDLGVLHVSTSPTRHSERINSVAYRFDQDDTSLVLSGDCDYDEGIIGLANNADTLVVDCSFPDALKIDGHLSAGECGRIASQAQVRKLVLSHLYPVPAGHETRVAEARAACCADVLLAEDLMVIE
jgi:ribonuclease BN (tRNA processing enzyme)